MKEINENILKSALYYREKGFSVIPVGSDKKPLISWKKYQDEKADEAQIRKWFEVQNPPNIGIVTGKISGIVVVDIEKGGSSEGYPPTVTAKSGGDGIHLFYKHPGYEVLNGARVRELTDIRGDGGYVLAAPSVSDKGEYQWLVSLDDSDFSEWPVWITKTASVKEEKKWLSAKDGVSEGSRNDAATSMAGKIISSMDPELWDILGWEQLEIWNSKNTPPLKETELRTVWESIKKRHVEDNKKQWRNIPEEKNINYKAIVRCFSDIKSVPISWLWEGRIALGKLTMIVGDPGLGKSLITATLATHVSKGYPWPVDESKPPIGDVILISAEDDSADTIKPRLEAAEADCTRIHVVEAIQEESVDNEGEPVQHMFSFKRDLEALGELLSSLPNCRLVIIDPISAYLGGADSNKNSDIRELLAPLSKLAEKYKTAFVLVSHLNKSSGENLLYRTTGSLAFIAAVRTAYIVAKDPENPDRRLLMPLKSNISKEKTGLAYSIMEAENNAPVIVWESQAVEMTVDEVLDSSESTEERTATDEAVDFLLDLLANGPVKANDVQTKARQVGISKKPLRSAREKLGIKPKKSSTFADGFWEWSLPEDALRDEEALSEGVGTLDKTRHLGDIHKSRLDVFVDSLNEKVDKDKDGIDIPQKLPEQPPIDDVNNTF
jgi:putative DNA primase/helicase